MADLNQNGSTDITALQMQHMKQVYRHRPPMAFPKNKRGGSQEQPRIKIMKGEKLGRGAGSGCQEQRQAWETRWQSRRETNEGRQGGQNGDHEGRQMKGDKAAAAAKSRPEWRS